MFMRPAMEADLKPIKQLYQEAFPRLEQTPFAILTRQWRREVLDILVFREEDGSFVGFSINVPEEDIVMIDYLAVSPQARGSGYGSRALELLHLYYLGKRIFLIMEQPNADAPNSEQRLQRQRFYLRNGYADSGIRVNGAEGEMQLLVYVGREHSGAIPEQAMVSGEDYLRLQRKSMGNLLMWLGNIHIEKPRLCK